MAPLRTNRRILTLLCACPLDESAGEAAKYGCIAFCMSVFVALLCGLSASMAFVIKYISTDLEGCLYSLYQIVAFGSAMYSMVGFLLLKRKATAIFDNLSDIYDAYEDEECFDVLVAANARCEWMWEIYFVFILAGFVVSTGGMVGLSAVLCWYFFGHFNAKAVFHPYEMMFPWDQTTLLGYVYEIFLSIIAAEAYLFCNGALLLLFISVCLNHQAFYRMFVQWARQIDHFDDIPHGNEYFGKLIRFRTLVRGYFSDSSEVFSLFILVQLICSMMYLASSIFQLDLHSTEVDYKISVLLMSVLVSSSNLFLYCFFGKLATESFETMADCLYETNWLDLPVNLQKYFIVMIGNAQIPIHYHGFGVALLNLETFLKMIKTVVTYYMMFKTLTE